MRKVLLGKKEGMSRLYDAEGSAVPVTVIQSLDCVLVGCREFDGINSVQLGLEKTDKVNRPVRGQFESRGIEPRKILREFQVSADSPLLEIEAGELIKPSLFETGEVVDVTAVTKGRGFQGVVKRWNFAGGPASHGGRFARRTGSIGQAADPSRVFPGRKMPGQYGGDTQTVQCLTVERIIEDESLILVAGSIPGARGGTVVVRSTLKGDK